MTTTCPYCHKPFDYKLPHDGAVIACPECGGQSEVHVDAKMNLHSGDVASVVVLEPLDPRRSS